MILIGMYDSPFTRPVAIALRLLGFEFEHANWSVGSDYERIRRFNPLVRVPTLVLDDGEALIESAAILDYLDEQVAPDRRLLPAMGRDRRDALQIVAMARGIAEKGRELIYERVFRPPEKRHEPWLERCRAQVSGGLAQLERRCAQRGDEPWLVGERISQSDIVLTCAVTFLVDAGILPRGSADFPVVLARVARCEALPEFSATRAPWSAPQS
jgi:glutathione S-transferase